MKSPNVEEQTKRIRRFLGIQDDEVIELINMFALPNDKKKLKIGMAMGLEGHTTLLCSGNDGVDFVGTYMMVNKVNPALGARYRPNIWENATSGRAKDNDVEFRRAIYIDLDSKKPATGISASDAELRAVEVVAGDLRSYLEERLVPDCVGFGCSGNGYYLLLAVEDAPAKETTEQYSRFLKLLSLKFGSNAVEIDSTVVNPARLMPAPATLKSKGWHTIDRPHRETWFECSETVKRVPFSLVLGVLEELETEVGGLAPVVQLATTKPKKEKPAPAKPTSTIRDFGDAKMDQRTAQRLTRASHYIAKMDAAIDGQGGHAQTFKVACILAKKFDCSEDEIFELLRDEYNPRCQPPWSDAELQHKAKDAFRAAAGEKHDEPQEEPAVILGVNEIFAPLPPIPYVVQALEIAPGGLTILGGQGYTGKSLIAQAMEISVSSGKNVWNRFPCAQGSVLHLDYEQGTSVTCRRYQRLAAGIGATHDDLDERFGVIIRPKFYLDSREGQAKLRSLLKGRTLCVIDSFRAAFPSVNEDDSGTRKHLDPLAEISEDTGCSIVLLAHARKGRATGGSLSNLRNSLRGSAALFDSVATALMLQCDPSGENRTLNILKARNDGTKSPPIAISISGEDDSIIVTSALSPMKCHLREDLKSNLRERIIDVFKNKSNIQSLSQLMREYLGMTRGPKNNQDVKNIIDDLVTEGLITSVNSYGYIWLPNYQKP